MNRKEFINLLTDSLVGRLPGALISEKADYYRKYITEHARETGQSEEAVIEELGPPEMIAHTIIDVYEAEYGIYEGSEEAAYEEEKYADRGFLNRGQPDSADRNDNGKQNKLFSFVLGEKGCFLIGFLILLLFLAAGTWLVRFISAYPLVVAAVVVAYILWVQYKRRH